MAAALAGGKRKHESSAGLSSPLGVCAHPFPAVVHGPNLCSTTALEILLHPFSCPRSLGSAPPVYCVLHSDPAAYSGRLLLKQKHLSRPVAHLSPGAAVPSAGGRALLSGGSPREGEGGAY